MSAEIIEFPKRHRRRAARKLRSSKPVPETEPESFAERLNYLAERWRQWSAYNEAGIAAILDDARDAGREWPDLPA